MDLFFFTLLTGFVLLALGAFFALNPSKTEAPAKRLPRSKVVASVTMTLAAGWFLYRHVMNLSDADFGEHKMLIGIITIVLLGLSFKFLPDFLAVRGIATLVLFFAREVLNAAFLQEPQIRLFLVSVIYIGIVAALYLAAWPYRLRDFLDWLYSVNLRPRVLGAALAGYGLLLCVIAFGY
tara:strand:- start:848 stop:1387 length:540 start_codon:yes stop_codon:yes gene_type:complete